MSQFKFTAFGMFFLSACFSLSVQADTWSLGASLLYSESPYRGGQDRYLPIPVVNYEGDNFWVHSLQAGYYLWKTDQDRLSLTILGSPLGFDPKDDDLAEMKGLDKRRMTVMGGFSYLHRTPAWGTLRALLTGDMLDNSNGIAGDIAWLYRMQFGNLSLVPGMGATWTNGRYNRYYYGVSGSEANKTGIASYRPDDSWMPYAEVTASYRLNSHWNGFASVHYTALSSEVKESPIIDKRSQVLLWTGINYRF
ncbi:MipA/OmpV family protein [Enterobacteriaceae bacterium LUAb1]